MYKQASLLNGRRIMQFDALPKSFCDCWSYQNTKQRTCSCACGEEDSRDREWQWEQNDYPTTKLVDETTVIFHPIYSQGTSVVRGNTPLAPGRHHFWEIKMTSTVCGTDLMVGVGTAQVDLMANKYRFVSALGLDSHSWGYSYRGVAQHDNVSRLFGQKFGAGSIVSCHLDLFRGTLEFYLNRLPLGIAFRNLAVDGSCEYYPMVSSTAAKSSVKLLNSSSFPECLQYQSMVAISRYPSVLNKLLRLPQGFRYKDKLWYLQRTEKFKYSRKQPANNRQDLLFEETTGAFEGDKDDDGSRSSAVPDEEEFDIYDSIDEDIIRIQEQEREQQQQCHKNNPESAGEEEEDASVVLFSYFCDHFA